MFSALPAPSRPLLVQTKRPLYFDVHGAQTMRVLRLENPTGNACVAYKLRTTQPALFRVRQSEGVLRPGEGCDVRISVKGLPEGLLQPPEGMPPKFQVLSVGLGENDAERQPPSRVQWETVPDGLLHRHVIPCRFSTQESDRRKASPKPAAGRKARGIPSGPDAQEEEEDEAISAVTRKDPTLPEGRTLEVLVEYVSASGRRRRRPEAAAGGSGSGSGQEWARLGEVVDKIRGEITQEQWEAWLRHAKSVSRRRSKKASSSSSSASSASSSQAPKLGGAGADPLTDWVKAIRHHRDEPLEPPEAAPFSSSSPSMSSSSSSEYSVSGADVLQRRTGPNMVAAPVVSAKKLEPFPAAKAVVGGISQGDGIEDWAAKTALQVLLRTAEHHHLEDEGEGEEEEQDGEDGGDDRLVLSQEGQGSRRLVSREQVDEGERERRQEARGRAAAVEHAVQSMKFFKQQQQSEVQEGEEGDRATKEPTSRFKGSTSPRGTSPHRRMESSTHSSSSGHQRREERDEQVLKDKVMVVATLASGLGAAQANLRDAVVEGLNIMSREIVTFASVLHRICLRQMEAATAAASDHHGALLGESGRTLGSSGAARSCHRQQPQEEEEEQQQQGVGVHHEVLSVCRLMTEQGSHEKLQLVGNRDVEVREGRKVKGRFRFDTVLQRGGVDNHGSAPSGRARRRREDKEEGSVFNEVKESMLGAVHEGGVFCLLSCASSGKGGGLSSGLQGGGRGLFCRSVELIMDQLGDEQEVSLTVAALEVRGQRVRDLLGRPSGAASEDFYELCNDRWGQAYITNVLQVQVHTVSDVERLCGVVAGRRQSSTAGDESPLLTSHQALSWPSDFNNSPAAAACSPANQHSVIIILTVIFPDTQVGVSRPRTSRLYFVDIALQTDSSPSSTPTSTSSSHAKRAQVVGMGGHHVHSVSRALKRRRAAAARGGARPSSPSPPYTLDVREGGRLVSLLGEALAPSSRVAVVTTLDGAQSIDDQVMPVLHLGAQSLDSGTGAVADEREGRSCFGSDYDDDEEEEEKEDFVGSGMSGRTRRRLSPSMAAMASSGRGEGNYSSSRPVVKGGFGRPAAVWPPRPAAAGTSGGPRAFEAGFLESLAAGSSSSLPSSPLGVVPIPRRHRLKPWR